MKSGKRLAVMSGAGLVGGFVAFLLSKVPADPTSDAGLKVYAGLTFMLMIIAIGAALIIGNSILDGHPPSGETIAVAAVALAGLGFLSGYIAQALFTSMLDLEKLSACISDSCIASAYRPARTLGWALAGTLGGFGIGLAFRSKKRLQNATLGGLLGGLVGGFLFDLIPLMVDSQDGGDSARFVAVAIIGILIGVLIAAIDAARSDMFLEVLSGEMRGRQFLVMDESTKVGSARTAGVVLLADREIAEVHLTIQRSAGSASFGCNTVKPVLLNGVQTTAGSLAAGDVLRIGNTEVRVGFKKASGASGPSVGQQFGSSSSPSTGRPTASAAAAGNFEPQASPPTFAPPPRSIPGAATPPPPNSPRPRLPTKPQ